MGGAVYSVLGSVCGGDDGHGDQRGLDTGGVPYVEHPSCGVGAILLLAH